MIFEKSRRERESLIVDTMIRMYCQHWHSPDHGICAECTSLQQYCHARLKHCIFGELKPVCKECPVHCYSRQRKEDIKKVMQWAGPKMLFAHPLYAFIHIWDSRKRKRNS